MLSIGVDVGGTFTDIVAFDDATGALVTAKTSSTPANQAEGVLRGIRKIAENLSRIDRIVHGMTVATNAILERKLAVTGILTTQGFRDTLEIGKTNRTVVYDMKYQKPEVLVPRRLRREVPERLRYDGTVAVPLDEEAVEAEVRALLDLGMESLAICFLHSYRNPDHERRAAAIARRIRPDLPISVSADVVPEYREYERLSTAVLNAKVMPVMDRYLGRLERDLRQGGYASDLYIMHSGGGIMTAQTARERPVLTILSGPAGGLVGAAFIGEAAGYRNLITYDMGGTSTDVSLIADLTPRLTTYGRIEGYPVRTPLLDIKTIGAGGGSMAWVDGQDLRVGPRSAGAVPGPAAYGRGGTEATVTDANVVLGRLSARRLLGAEIALNPDLARQAVERIAARFPGYEAVRTAEGILTIVVNNMANAIREISVQRGHDPREFVLVAFGGAGPMCAAQLAGELGMRTVLCPPAPGNLCALGLLASDTVVNTVRTHLTRTAHASFPETEKIFAEMEELAAQTIGPRRPGLRFGRSIDVRYVGQASEITIPVDGRVTRMDLEAAFHQRHEMLYGQGEPGEPTEIVNLRLTAVIPNPRPSLLPPRAAGDPLIETRPVHFGTHGFVDCPVYEREGLATGTKLAGPAIVEEDGSTTVIWPGQSGSVDAIGNLLIHLS